MGAKGGGGLHYMDGAYVLAFFRNGAKEARGGLIFIFFTNGENLAHYFRRMSTRQKSVLVVGDPDPLVRGSVKALARAHC
jgi:hypothetical protein